MNDDQDDKKFRMMPLGDIGVIGIALVFFVAFLWMMFAPSPFAGMFPPEKNGAASSVPQAASSSTDSAAEISGTTGEIIMPLAGKPSVARDVPFPEIRNWNSLHIALERSACFGTCPIYSVDISGDGTVSYDGLDCVAQKGHRTGRVSRAAMENLVSMFRRARYFSLSDRFTAQITDAPSYRTAIRFDDRSKSVLDYVGLSAGMPPAVRDLEIAIDRTAGTDKWVGASPGHCSWMSNPRP